MLYTPLKAHWKKTFDEDAVQKDINLVPYSIVKNTNSDAWVEANGKKIAPPEV